MCSLYGINLPADTADEKASDWLHFSENVREQALRLLVAEGECVAIGYEFTLCIMENGPCHMRSSYASLSSRKAIVNLEIFMCAFSAGSRKCKIECCRKQTLTEITIRLSSETNQQNGDLGKSWNNKIVMNNSQFTVVV